MSRSRMTAEQRGQTLLEQVKVDGVYKLQVRGTAVDRVCESEQCPEPGIRPGEEFLRVVYQPGRRPEIFHRACFLWEFT